MAVPAASTGLWRHSSSKLRWQLRSVAFHFPPCPARWTRHNGPVAPRPAGTRSRVETSDAIDRQTWRAPMRIRPLICHSRCPIVVARACSIAAPFRPRRRSAGSGASAQPAGFNRTGSACICSKLTCAANSFHRFLIWFSSLPWRSTTPPTAPGPAMGPHPGRWLHCTDCPMPQPARCWPAHPASSSTRCSHSPGRKRTAATAGHWSAATAPPLHSAVRSVCAAARCAQSQHGAFALQPAPIASDPRNRSRSWAAP